ncbi:MAG TPA: hypothetical protein VGK67_00260 [Myxococcales bacterium]|jgi:hypothetical protein
MSLRFALAQAAPEGSIETEPTEAEQIAGLQRMLHHLEGELQRVEERSDLGNMIGEKLKLVPGTIFFAAIMAWYGLPGLAGLSGAEFLRTLAVGFALASGVGMALMIVGSIVSIVVDRKELAARREELLKDREEYRERLRRHGAAAPVASVVPMVIARF